MPRFVLATATLRACAFASPVHAFAGEGIGTRRTFFTKTRSCSMATAAGRNGTPSQAEQTACKPAPVATPSVEPARCTVFRFSLCTCDGKCLAPPGARPEMGRCPDAEEYMFQEMTRNRTPQMPFSSRSGTGSGLPRNQSTRACRFEGTMHIASVVLLIR